MRRGRILLTVPHVNGAASPYREMMSIARYLSRSEFDLSICALRDAGFEESKQILDEMGVPCFVAPFRPRGKSLACIFDSLMAQRMIAKRGPFDIQHSLDFTSSPFEAVMAEFAGRRYMYNQRNLNDHGHEHLLRVKLRLSACVVAIANHVAGFVRSLGAKPAKIERILNGIDVNQADRELAAAPVVKSNRLLMVGQVVRLKRYEDAIRAFRLVKQHDTDLKLAIAGPFHDAPYLEDLKQLIQSLGLAGDVDFLGPRLDVLALMRDSLAVVLCSRTEGLPWAALEAMVARAPVIASDIPAHREIIDPGQTGLLFPVGDPGALATALGGLLADPERAGAMTNRARTAVESKFSAQSMVAGLEKTYRRLLNMHSVSSVPSNAWVSASQSR